MRDAMLAWKEDVHVPLVVDIYWDADDHRVLLEQWTVLYAPLFADNDHRTGQNMHGYGGGYPLTNTRDVIQQLKEVCKKISVLLRALHAFIRMLPAHRLVRQSYPSRLSYEIHSRSSAIPDADDSSFADDAMTSGYSFIPITTPFGYLKVSAVYRQNCDQWGERQARAAPAQIFKDNFIIQDYVPGSPEMVTAPAKPVDDYSLGPPMAAMDLRTDSFVPVSDADQFGAEPRRRSSPQTIPKADLPAPARRTQSISQPMAIPQTKTTTVFEDRGGMSPHANSKVVQHAHSYGDPERLRTIETNPNVQPAPYGYGNVSVDPRFTPPSDSPQPQHPWLGSAEGSSEGAGTSISPTIGHDDGSGPYRPLSTPPRHPKTVSMLRNNRGVTASGLRRTPNSIAVDYHQPRGSLENFTLDDTDPTMVGIGPSQAPPTSSAEQAKTFRYASEGDGGFAPDSSSTSTASGSGQKGSATGTSLHMTPPFSYMPSGKYDATSGSSDRGSENLPTSTSITLKKTSPAGMPAFDASPPFLANPCELLSTSPGYSYSKNYLRTGPSSLPMFVTTGQFRPGGDVRTGSDEQRIAGTQEKSSSNQPSADKRRQFASDFDSSAGFWGVSPDTPDALGLVLAGSNGSYRQRLLSASDGADDSLNGDLLADDIDTTLPFALGNDSNLSNATTVTATSSGSCQQTYASSTDSAAVPSWETATVGNFLYQLNNAPPLQIDSSAGGKTLIEPNAVAAVDRDVSAADGPITVSAFDDELENFRSLRDELTQHM